MSWVAVRGVYREGKVEPLERVSYREGSEVLVLFPEHIKRLETKGIWQQIKQEMAREMPNLLTMTEDEKREEFDRLSNMIAERMPYHSVEEFEWYSLYVTKNVAAGEGGMITTDDEALTERCRMLRNHGMRRRYHYEFLGYNFRMTDLHAAIALAQMDRLEEFTARRRANAAYLSAHITSVLTPRVREGYEHVWHQYTVRVDGGRDRDAVVRKLREAGVGTGIFYPVPVHQQDYIRDVVGEVSLPVAERLAKEVLSLPVHPGLSQADLEMIVAAVNSM